jgi:hypothetical protein
MTRAIRCGAVVLVALLAVSGCGPRSTGGGDGDGGGNNNNTGDGGVEHDAFVCDGDRVVCEGTCCEEGEFCWDSQCCDQVRRCGNHCCGADELCLGGYCYPDCGQGTLCLDTNDQEICCDWTEICFMNQCLTPGNWCDSDADCALTEYCEESINACLPIPGNTGNNFGGAPVVADFDGDGYREIGTAGGGAMAVFDPDGPTPVLWQQPTKDTSSAITGCTVFDFEGDGSAEIVYTDECFVYIYRGTDGEILFQESNNTRTHNEFPIVVDVDADGNSELLVTANICNWSCGTMPGWTGPLRRGIKVYGDVQLNWVRTRKIWNQHSYHVTNVNDDGTIPSPEPQNWLVSGLNNYRQNVQTWGVHNAPNMVGTHFGADTRLCAVGGSIALGLMVENEGSKGVPAGIHVGFYRIYNGSNTTFIGSVQTTDPILPGMIEYVELIYDIPPEDNPLPDEFWFSAVVDDASILEVAIHECHEDDNTVGPITVSCAAVN